MGYIRHHAIVVTSWDENLIKEAHKEAIRLCKIVTEVTSKSINEYFSFLIAPDGSKEGWAESDEGDMGRNLFINWLDAHRYNDGSTALAWVEVQFGDEEQKTLITRHSDDPQYFGPLRSSATSAVKSLKENKMEELKFCINCKYYWPPDSHGLHGMAKCEKAIDIVTGTQGAITCKKARMGQFCGLEATGFEKKEPDKAVIL